MSWQTQADILTYNYSDTPGYATTPVPHRSAVPLSSYSSLSGALDPPPTKTRLRSYSSHNVRTSTNAEYPYPVSRHDPYNSSTRARARTGSNSQTPLAERNGALSRDSGCGGHYCHDELIQPVCVMKPPRWPTGPTNHVPVPQREFREEYIPKRPSYKDAHIRYPPITFQTFGIPELGVRVGKVAERYAPSIVGGNDPVFAAAGDREVKFWILWPGYSSEPLQKRIKTRDGTVTRDTVLMIIANALTEYTCKIQRKGTPVEPGYEDWTIGPRTDGKQGIVGTSLFITRLHHRGGSAWQPEIWAPRRP